MKLFYKFAFWLPFFSFLLILMELFLQPANSLVWTAIDPVYVYLHSLLPEAFNSLYFLLLLHFLLALLYGFAIDALIKKILESQPNE
ncbi:hypothetical protein QWY14_04165 [Planococcus sp. N028]|uniref:Uncharacterized protein n=1 Tax=Planococcus shixiaomingii TaxID=3058393 RepID=A0ABT8MZD2_9BACL|nr:hypothetical protein [Planococcus sp. N028]MDN7240969.1 hypothetical protein [Planococcus sp. N028]